MKTIHPYNVDFFASKRARRRGSIAILGTVTMTALLGMLGLAFDATYLYHLKREAQTAADAGARAAALELQKGSTATKIATEAKAETATNGFTDGANSVTVTVNQPPVGGNWAGNANAVQIIVTRAVSTSFMQVLGLTNAQVSAESVGGKQSGGACVYALNPTVNHAVIVSGGSSVVNLNCAVVDDSSASHAFDVSGGATFSATSVNVVGLVEDTSGADLCGANCTISDAPNNPNTGITAEADPLASIAEPAVGACTYTGVLGNTSYVALNGGAVSALPAGVLPAITGIGTQLNPYVLSPGTYCNGIKVGAGQYATFNPGTYILNAISGSNQAFNVSGGGYASGTGVTFFLTARDPITGVANAGNYRSIAISGTSTVSFSAPTSGALKGMLFFQDRTLTGVSNTGQESFTGGSQLTLEGALYFPLDNVVFSGGTAAHPDYLIIVADTITFSGGSTINNDYSGLLGGSPIQVTGIIE
jgi:Flp pilus assembly protein TadG